MGAGDNQMTSPESSAQKGDKQRWEEIGVTFAATRDAAWHNFPDVSSPKKFHIMVNCCMPKCGANMILCSDYARRADNIPEISRCKRCRVWPDYRDPKTNDTIRWTT